MAKTCGMCDCMREKLIMDRLLLGITDEVMRERCISSADLYLNRAIDTCRAVEAASIQLKAMKIDHAEVHAASRKLPVKHKSYKKSTESSSHSSNYARSAKFRSARKPESKRCKFCNRIHPMRKEDCPAYGKVCDACNIKNHFKGSRKCRANQIYLINEYSSEDSESSVTINTVTVGSVMSDNKAIFCEMKVNKQLIKLQIDCGATVCIFQNNM